MNLIIQGLGAIGIIASIISFQCKNHKKILLFRTLNEFFFGIQFLLLGAYTGMAMNFVGCVRNVIFSNRVENKKSTRVPVVIFCMMFVAFGILTWQGKRSILVIAAKLLSTIAYGNKNETVVRTIIFIASTCWLIYNAMAGSVAGILCESFSLGSLIIGIMKYDIIPKVKKITAVDNRGGIAYTDIDEWRGGF